MSQHCLTRGLEVQPSWTLANVAVALHIATCSNPYYEFDSALALNISIHLHLCHVHHCLPRAGVPVVFVLPQGWLQHLCQEASRITRAMALMTCILAEGATALPVTLSGGALFAI